MIFDTYTQIQLVDPYQLLYISFSMQKDRILGKSRFKTRVAFQLHVFLLP